jgi:hypothetical protein
MEEHGKILLVVTVPGPFNESYIIKDLVDIRRTNITRVAGDPFMRFVRFTWILNTRDGKFPRDVSGEHIGIQDVLKRALSKRLKDRFRIRLCVVQYLLPSINSV